MTRFSVLLLMFGVVCLPFAHAQRASKGGDTRWIAKKKEATLKERYLAQREAKEAPTPPQATARVPSKPRKSKGASARSAQSAMAKPLPPQPEASAAAAAAAAPAAGREWIVTSGRENHRWKRRSTLKKPIFGN